MLVQTTMQVTMHATMLVQTMMQMMNDGGICDTLHTKIFPHNI
jgi:hypothetical protein